ncbi:hypothetical protein OPV22_011489 [Ensete ventricosum]|uniref:Uncharacterized protein n=1 Tax=Ensete ventricosum TaxID=4639 RepID=A0AAV8RJ63_ENSVE|nr:hypothetical protein OPV22_011489 [Ensete ventricosum]
MDGKTSFAIASDVATAISTLYQRSIFRYNRCQLRQERYMKPGTYRRLVAALLCEKKDRLLFEAFLVCQ